MAWENVLECVDDSEHTRIDGLDRCADETKLDVKAISEIWSRCARSVRATAPFQGQACTHSSASWDILEVQYYRRGSGRALIAPIQPLLLLPSVLRAPVQCYFL